MTIKEIINVALWTAGVLPNDDTFRRGSASWLSSEVTTEAFKTLNRMLVSWQCPLILPEPTVQPTLLTVPPGYAQAIVYNLAVELAPLFGVQPSTVMEQMAYESRRALFGPVYHLTAADFEMIVLLKEARAKLVQQRQDLVRAA